MRVEEKERRSTEAYKTLLCRMRENVIERRDGKCERKIWTGMAIRRTAKVKRSVGMDGTRWEAK